MATDAEIQKFVQRHHGFIPKTGWIAHVKEVHGIPTLREANRARHDRDVEPCPQEKREAIEEALRHFGVIWTAGRAIGTAEVSREAQAGLSSRG
jgi:hypothetical protein